MNKDWEDTDRVLHNMSEDNDSVQESVDATNADVVKPGTDDIRRIPSSMGKRPPNLPLPPDNSLNRSKKVKPVCWSSDKQFLRRPYQII